MKKLNLQLYKTNPIIILSIGKSKSNQTNRQYP